MRLFGKKKPEQLPQTYRPVMEAQEVIDLFSRMTLHQQAALMRLVSRNLIVELPNDSAMGYELDWNVDGALIVAQPTLVESATPSLQSPDDA